MRTKVLHIYNIMNRGGAETFIMNVYNNINKNLYQFDFLCTSSLSGDYDENIIENGGRVFYFKNFSSKKIFSNILYTYKILKNNGPYDVIHIPMQFYSWVFCIAARLAKIKKIIVHSHSAGDYYNKRLIRRIYMKLSRFMINILSTNKLACGKSAGNYLFGSNSKFDILYNGIDLKRFGRVSNSTKKNLKKKYKLDNVDLVIGHVGNFSSVKNHKYFINIAKELIRRNLSFKIILIGDGKERKNIENQIEKNNLNKYFVFSGNVDNVNELYSVMNIFVMPSLYEGFPVSIIEAIASGLPCLLSNNITNEVMIVEDECTFFDLNDSIINVCDILCDNSKKEFNYKNNQLQLIKYKFDIESVSNKLTDYYRK